jgi:hypothetical protein
MIMAVCSDVRDASGPDSCAGAAGAGAASSAVGSPEVPFSWVGKVIALVLSVEEEMDES